MGRKASLIDRRSAKPVVIREPAIERAAGCPQAEPRPAHAAVLEQLTELYVGARFGRQSVPDRRLRDLSGRLSDLGRAA